MTSPTDKSTTEKHTTEKHTMESTRQPSRGVVDRKDWITLAAVIAIQLLIVLLAVLPQLSPRVSGTEVQLRIAPVDPIDPGRGAHVELTYLDLPAPRGDEFDAKGSPVADEAVSDRKHTIYVPLRRNGEVWVGGPAQQTEPDGLFLKCADKGWRYSCGIESWFASQSEARALEREMRDDGGIATVRVDRWGNAAIVGLTPAGR